MKAAIPLNIDVGPKLIHFEATWLNPFDMRVMRVAKRFAKPSKVTADSICRAVRNICDISDTAIATEQLQNQQASSIVNYVQVSPFR